MSAIETGSLEDADMIIARQKTFNMWIHEREHEAPVTEEEVIELAKRKNSGWVKCDCGDWLPSDGSLSTHLHLNTARVQGSLSCIERFSLSLPS